MPSTDYIVRIYRYEKNKPHKLIGVVEEVGLEEKKAFSSLDELWKILNEPCQKRQARKKGIRD